MTVWIQVVTWTPLPSSFKDLSITRSKLRNLYIFSVTAWPGQTSLANVNNYDQRKYARLISILFLFFQPIYTNHENPLIKYMATLYIIYRIQWSKIKFLQSQSLASVRILFLMFELYIRQSWLPILSKVNSSLGFV